jgi:hypothetical protein
LLPEVSLLVLLVLPVLLEREQVPVLPLVLRAPPLPGAPQPEPWARW